MPNLHGWHRFLAELNKYEYAAGGEFGFGTAQQYGEADLKGRDFSNQKLQRANFTAADCRDCNFSGSNLQAAYLIKTVVVSSMPKPLHLLTLLPVPELRGLLTACLPTAVEKKGSFSPTEACLLVHT